MAKKLVKKRAGVKVHRYSSLANVINQASFGLQIEGRVSMSLTHEEAEQIFKQLSRLLKKGAN